MTVGVAVYQLVLAVHITAVMVAFGALFAYPIFLSVNARAPISERAGLHRLQVAFSKYVTAPAIGVVIAAGGYLATDAHLWSRAWLLAGFALLVLIAGLGATVLRRGELRLIATADTGDEAGYARGLAVLKAWTRLTLALIVVAILLMTARP